MDEIKSRIQSDHHLGYAKPRGGGTSLPYHTRPRDPIHLRLFDRTGTVEFSCDAERIPGGSFVIAVREPAYSCPVQPLRFSLAGSLGSSSPCPETVPCSGVGMVGGLLYSSSGPSFSQRDEYNNCNHKFTEAVGVRREYTCRICHARGDHLTRSCPLRFSRNVPPQATPQEILAFEQEAQWG